MHDKVCPCQPIRCQFFECDFVGTFMELTDHFFEVHNHRQLIQSVRKNVYPTTRFTEMIHEI